MILNFFFDNFKHSKQRLHLTNLWLIFMILFLKIKMENKKILFINLLINWKKNELIYFDEFQVTNIVDAMILGNLFKKYLMKI